ncbi:hypothetical protein BU16DRAFT_82586 [Lophium mytilinum]|uniref:Uncharacterized protein n=1 Tax=Lophium mytilinum TaxID=390894 RepID=A0A6A6QM05_9PEZI|nr:hypothetical protein BU16DRAFT_82586 [Lophium mytilinum]
MLAVRRCFRDPPRSGGEANGRSRFYSCSSRAHGSHPPRTEYKHSCILFAIFMVHLRLDISLSTTTFIPFCPFTLIQPSHHPPYPTSYPLLVKTPRDVTFRQQAPAGHDSTFFVNAISI